jgi:uncharacterized protein YjbK
MLEPITQKEPPMYATEKESKFEIDARAFEWLLQNAKVERQDRQVNVYYDSRSRLSRSAATFRVRYTKGAPAQLTLKQSYANVDGVRVAQEYDYILAGISSVRFSPPEIDVEGQLVPELAALLRKRGISKLARLGAVRNYRYQLLIGGVGQVELDRLRLPDGSISYEVEIENEDDSVHERIRHWIFSHIPNARVSTTSKFERFMSSVLAAHEARLKKSGVDLSCIKPLSGVGSSSATSGVET